MKITKMTLKKYRNYDNLEISFNDNLNIIIGDNAQGKTNLLESIYVLGVTRSFLSGNDRNLIKFENKASLIKGEVITNDGKFNLEVLINENGKVVKVNSKEIKKLSDYISLLNVIVFNSDSIRIFKDSPNSRRKYFNIEISQINKKYLKLLSDYNTILRQRNEFLKVININKEKDMMYLSILNEKYALLSLEIYNYRKKFIDDINMYLGNSFKYIAGYDNLVIKYASNFSNFDNKTFLEKLNDNLNRDIQYKMTLIGPNRDDFYFLLGDKNLSLYGSQGQIRSAVLALKLSEVKLFNNITGDTPILLLDDMFSELDINKRNNILKYLDRNIQTIITTTDIKNINEKIKEKLQAVIDAESAAGDQSSDGFVNGLTADVVERLTQDDDANEETSATQEELENHINELREEAESIIADANEQAQKIIDDADEQVKRAAKEAKDNGYEEGLAQADAEYSLRKDELEKEYESRKKQLEQEYTEKRNKIEPELINVLTDVYNKVILSIADEDKEVLVHLINGVLSDAEKSDEFVIKCSPQDYSYISENQGKIFCNMSKDITLDITTDETLGKNDCIIETDGAVFDCSLDKELANLTKKIKMLSCLD